MLLEALSKETRAQRGVMRHDNVREAGVDDRGGLRLSDFFLWEPVDALGAQVLVDGRRPSDRQPPGGAPPPAVPDLLGEEPNSGVG